MYLEVVFSFGWYSIFVVIGFALLIGTWFLMKRAAIKRNKDVDGAARFFIVGIALVIFLACTVAIIISHNHMLWIGIGFSILIAIMGLFTGTRD